MSQIVVDITRLVRDEGTIVVFEGIEEGNGDLVQIAVDHRMAQPIASALDRGEEAHAWAEGYQIISRTIRRAH
jgi:hypothetical protein